MDPRDTIDRYCRSSFDRHPHARGRYRPTTKAISCPRPCNDDFRRMGQDLRQARSDDLIIRDRQQELGTPTTLRIADMDRRRGWPPKCCCPTPFRSPFLPYHPPTSHPACPATREGSARSVGRACRAHNRWQIDFCSLAPVRRRGLVQIFPNDVELALEEIRWGAEQDLLRRGC